MWQPENRIMTSQLNPNQSVVVVSELSVGPVCLSKKKAGLRLKTSCVVSYHNVSVKGGRAVDFGRV